VSGLSRAHWPEYLIEAASLAAFMLSAAVFATLLQHPASPMWRLHVSPIVQRAFMGAAMGLTLAALVYSPWGQRSGAHMNPVVTVVFLWLGKIEPRDAAAYVVAQFAGGAAGIALADLLLGQLPAHPSVNFVATVPGPFGSGIASLGEAVISFGMMLTVLIAANHPRHQHRAGLYAAVLVALYIVVEAPLSGMSMNPARSLGPALLAHTLDSMWIYFVAPAAGMGLAAALVARVRGVAQVRCAKLVHPSTGNCIFRCGHAVPLQEAL
jgi:aquaporin Z